jgi:hypothetical protein
MNTHNFQPMDTAAMLLIDFLLNDKLMPGCENGSQILATFQASDAEHALLAADGRFVPVSFTTP